MTSNIKKIKGTTVNSKSSNYMYIDKSESESMHRKQCRELKYKETCDKYIKHAINISMDKTSFISSYYGFMGLIHQGDNPNKETLIYIPHIPCRLHLSSYNLSCPQSNRTRVCQ